MARSATSRLLDNVGRRIRHLREDLNKPNNDDIRKAGLERQIENLNNFRYLLREQAKKNPDGKLTNEQIYEATERMKTDDNLTTTKKIIDEITVKMIFAEDFMELDEEKIRYFMSNPDIQDLLNKFQKLNNKYIGQSGDEIYRPMATDAVAFGEELLKDQNLTEDERKAIEGIIKEINDAMEGKGRKEGVLYPIGARKKNK